jgi:hypothetical protein
LAPLDGKKALKPVALDLIKRASHVDGSDGIATGLVVLAQEEGGISLDDPLLKRGLAWLEGHQYQEGSWWTSSLKGFRNQSSAMGRFMSDAATGYAVLALERVQSLRSASLSERDGETVGMGAEHKANQSARVPSNPARLRCDRSD